VLFSGSIQGLLEDGYDTFLEISAHPILLSGIQQGLNHAGKEGAVLAWGSFITVTLNFMIIAFVLFLVVRLINRLTHAEAAKAPTPPVNKQEELLAEIRDLLKSH